MKTFNILFIAVFTVFSFSISHAQGLCADTYNAGSLIAAAQGKALSVTDCYGNNYYTCREAQELLYQAEARLGNAVNDATLGGCRKCDLLDLSDLASTINLVYGLMNNMGYSDYNTELEYTIYQWSDQKYECGRMTHKPLDGPDITGTWTSSNGATVVIKIDKIRERYDIVLTMPTGLEYPGTVHYTSPYELYSDSWATGASVYNDAIVWSDQTWKRKKIGGGGGGGEKPPITGAGQYVIKWTGEGYARVSSATGVKRDWTAFFSIWVYEGESIDDYIAKWKSEADAAYASYCAGNKSGHGPFPENPVLWTDGPYYEVLEVVGGFGEFWTKYECENGNVSTGVACYTATNTGASAHPIDWFTLPCR